MMRLNEPELEISRSRTRFSWTAPHGKHRVLNQHLRPIELPASRQICGPWQRRSVADFAIRFRPRPLAPNQQKRPKHYQLTLAACAPAEWRQRRNVVGVAVPALVSDSLKL